MPINDIFDKNVTNYTCNGKCSNCGECSTDFLHLSKEEIIKIKNYIKQHKIKRQYHLPLTQTYVDITCPFRDNINKKCVIWKVRPSICKSFLCNKSREELNYTKNIFAKKYPVISMTNEFFGDNTNLEFLELMENHKVTFEGEK